VAEHDRVVCGAPQIKPWLIRLRLRAGWAFGLKLQTTLRVAKAEMGEAIHAIGTLCPLVIDLRLVAHGMTRHLLEKTEIDGSL
jgi:precorrin isomerase